MAVARRNQVERRRRPAANAGSSEELEDSTSTDREDFFDNSDDEKEHHDDDIYRGACSLGQFFLNPCLCMYTMVRRSYRRSRKPKIILVLERRLPKNLRMLPSLLMWGCAAVVSGALVVVLFLLALVTIAAIIDAVFPSKVIRPMYDSDLDDVKISIPILDPTHVTQEDMGGWLFPHKFFLPKTALDVSLAGTDSGGLLFKTSGGSRREINPRDDKLFEKYRDEVVNTKAAEKHVSKKLWFNDEIEDKEIECDRVNWKMLYKPNCNAAHEISLDRDNVDTKGIQRSDEALESYYISHGYFRDVWLLNQVDRDQKMVLKVLRYKHEANIGTMRSILNDAMIMERLSASPRIIDAYCHCGTTILAEAIPHEVEEYVVPGSGYIKPEKLEDEKSVKPRNKFTAEEKLDMALEMAESLAVLHGFEGGVIVHDDVQLCQWLRKRDGKLKLGDFNRATVMDYNRQKGAYCKFNNGAGYGNYRSPEEFAAGELDEKIDLFSFGNNIYGLITGLWVFYDNEDDAVVQKKLIGKEKAFIDPRYRERSMIERGLIEVMERCWEYDPDKRIDIFEAVQMLRKIKRDHDSQK